MTADRASLFTAPEVAVPTCRPAALSALSCTFLILASLASPALAGWSAEPVQVRATLATCPLVAATSDGRGGAIVVWQEGSATSGVLQAERITASGDMGTWPHAPVTFCSIDIQRHALGAVSDDVGGAFVWWMETATLYLTRLTPDGFIAEGWAARGFPLGSLPTSEFRPLVKPDGQGGVYVGWLQDPSGYSFQMVRFASDGAPAGGWPQAGRRLDLGPSANYWNRSFGFDPTPDSGLWVGAQVQDLLGLDSGLLAVQRLDGSGLPAAGWESGARGLFLLPQGSVGPDARTGLMALEEDGLGGVFVVSIDRQPTSGGELQPRLWRLDPEGSPPTGWTWDGLVLEPRNLPASIHPWSDGSVLAFPDQEGGVRLGLPRYEEGAWPRLEFTRHSADGATAPGFLSVDQSYVETAVRDDGGLFAGACKPLGPWQNWDIPAYIGLWQTSPGAGFVESQGATSERYYGDIGLASAGDGGAVLVWSQVLGRQGVFAVRVGRDGVVTAVPPAPAVGPLRVWYARGSGVQVAGETGPMTLALHDLTGREVARGESADAGEWTVPGTAALPSGMYFAKAVADGQVLHAKVVVVR